MPRPTTDMMLSQRIIILKQKEHEQLEELSSSIEHFKQSVSPARLISRAISRTEKNGSLKAEIVDTAISLGAGWVAKKLMFGHSKNGFKKLSGSVLQLLFSGFVKEKMHQARRDSNAG